jgi:hypothetical protein
MRFRIFDWQTPWFWIVAFAMKAYGKPWFELSVYEPNGPKGKPQLWWLYGFWNCKWEPIPDECGEYAPEPTTEVTL